MLLQLLQHSLNSFYVLFAFAFDIDKDVIKVYYHENVKLFYQNLINVALERGWYISQSKKYHLVLEIAIAPLKSRFPFITFSNPHSIVGIS